MYFKFNVLKISVIRNLKLIYILVICFVLYSMIQFASKRCQFYEVLNRNNKKFNINNILKQLFNPNNTMMSENEMFLEAERYSNLPLIYYSNWKTIDQKQDSLIGNFTVCDIELPSPHLLNFNNFYYQQLMIKNFTLFIYNAYYDNREVIKRVKVLTVTEFQTEFNSSDLW